MEPTGIKYDFKAKPWQFGTDGSWKFNSLPKTSLEVR